MLHNKPTPIRSKVIFTGSPADLWDKVRSRDRDASKQRARNVPLASADVSGGGRLLDEPKECLRRPRLITIGLPRKFLRDCRFSPLGSSKNEDLLMYKRIL